MVLLLNIGLNSWLLIIAFPLAASLLNNHFKDIQES
ncbi:hypothetical protein OROGR_013727 [Orobanche gracilis]